MAAVWICLCAGLNCAGWILSALHLLNRTGYLIVAALTVASWCVWRVRCGKAILPRMRWSKWCRRFRRPLPFAFLIIFLLAFLGGVLHGPSNYDGLAYREPRVLHWLAEGNWHWIHTDFPRLNTRAVGYEWVVTPLIALTHTDRWVFLVNTVSFSLLPGLMFGAFTRAGVKRRVAWHWMWLAPTGYCFLLQAGSIANDMFSAVFALAFVYFGLRARATKRIGDLWLSMLAVALCSGAKTSNLAIGLPWLIAVFPALLQLRFRPLATAAVLVIAGGSSLLPIMVSNQLNCHDWTGMKSEGSGYTDPMVKFANNICLVTLQNFEPPIFPMAPAWNRAVLQRMPTGWRAKVERNFESSGAHLELAEMSAEEHCGLGLGVSGMALISALWAGRLRKFASARSLGVFATPYHQYAFLGAAYVSLAVLMFNSGLTGIGRLLTPYYALLLLPWLALRGQELVVRKNAWRNLELTVFLLAALLLIISPGRPLWPAKSVLTKLNAENSSNRLLSRAYTVYTVQGRRADAFAPARALLPADAQVLGLITYDDPETSLWRPFGSRRIRHVTRVDTAADLAQRNIKYVLVTSEQFAERFNVSFEEWVKRMNGEVLQKIPLQLRANRAPLDWYLVRANLSDSENRSPP